MSPILDGEPPEIVLCPKEEASYWRPRSLKSPEGAQGAWVRLTDTFKARKEYVYEFGKPAQV